MKKSLSANIVLLTSSTVLSKYDLDTSELSKYLNSKHYKTDIVNWEDCHEDRHEYVDMYVLRSTWSNGDDLKKL